MSNWRISESRHRSVRRLESANLSLERPIGWVPKLQVLMNAEDMDSHVTSGLWASQQSNWLSSVRLVSFWDVQFSRLFSDYDLSPMRVLHLLAKPNYKPPKLKDKKKWSHIFHDFVKCTLTKNPKKRPLPDKLLQVLVLRFDGWFDWFRVITLSVDPWALVSQKNFLIELTTQRVFVTLEDSTNLLVIVSQVF